MFEGTHSGVDPTLPWINAPINHRLHDDGWPNTEVDITDVDIEIEDRKIGDEEIPFAETLALSPEIVSRIGTRCAIEGGDIMYEYFLQTVKEVVDILFKRAIKTRDVYLAHTQIINARQHDFPEYQEMRQQLLDLVIDLLAEPEKEAGNYRHRLVRLKRELEKDDFSGWERTFAGGGIVEERETAGDKNAKKRKLLKFAEEGQREMLPDLFAGALERGQIYWLREYLITAKKLGLTKYEEMKQQTLAFIEKELQKNDTQLVSECRERLQAVKRELTSLHTARE